MRMNRRNFFLRLLGVCLIPPLCPLARDPDLDLVWGRNIRFYFPEDAAFQKPAARGGSEAMKTQGRNCGAGALQKDSFSER